VPRTWVPAHTTLRALHPLSEGAHCYFNVDPYPARAAPETGHRCSRRGRGAGGVSAAPHPPDRFPEAAEIRSSHRLRPGPVPGLRGELGEDEEVAVGDHLAALCGDEASGVEVTAIESGGSGCNGPRTSLRPLDPGHRAGRGESIGPPGRTTEPLRISCTGEQEFSSRGDRDGRKDQLPYLPHEAPGRSCGPERGKEGRRPGDHPGLRLPAIVLPDRPFQFSRWTTPSNRSFTWPSETTRSWE